MTAPRSQPAEPAGCRSRLLQWRVVLPAGLFLWAFLLGVTPLRCYDIWWHLKTGEWILQHGQVPQLDLFTYTSLDRPWIDLHWGFQVLTALLHGLGGTGLLILAKAVCLMAAVAIAWNAGGNRLSPAIRTLCWILPVVCLSGRAVVRPEMLSLIFLALWLFVLSRMDRSPWVVWTLPALQLLWVNCHALFVLGLIVGACACADRLAREFCGGRFGVEARPDEPMLHQVRAGILTVTVGLCNPYFEEGLLFPWILYRKITVDRLSFSTIAEFRRPVDFALTHGLFANIYLLAVVVLWLVTALSFLWLGRQRRISIFRLLLFAAFSHLLWQASRNTSVFALVSGFVLTANLSDAAALKSSQNADRTATNWPAIFTAALLTALLVSVPTGIWSRLGREGRVFGLGQLPAWYAHDACRFVRQPGFPKTAFVSHIGQAGVFVFHNGQERAVFIDGRLEVPRIETFRAFVGIRRFMAAGIPAWQEFVRDGNGQMPAIILDSRYSRDQIEGMLRTPGWRLVFADPAAAVFIESDVANQLNLPKADIAPLLHPPSLRDL